MRKDKNKSEKVHGRMRAFGNNNERSQRSGAKRKGQALRIPDADQENTDSALQRSKTTNRAAALPETVTRGRRTAAG